MKVLVTGAAGFVGSHVAEALVRANHEVIGIDAFTPFYDRSQKEENGRAIQACGAELVRLDLATDDITPFVRDVECVLHLAAQPGLSDLTTFGDYVKNNIVATGRLLAAVEQKGGGAATKFLHISTSSVYGSEATGDERTLPAPTSVYGVTKLAAEQLVLARHREGAIGACALRIFSVYGPRERPDKFYPRLIRAILTDTEVTLFEGSEDHRRSFSYVGDIVSGVLLALERWNAVSGEILNIGSDVETTTREGLAVVEQLTGKKARIRREPKRSGDQLRTHANIKKAHRVLGYSPATSLRDGLAAEISWVEARLR